MSVAAAAAAPNTSQQTDDDVLNEDWINCRMVRSHGSADKLTMV
jgi:hypothetical protein